MTMAWKTCQSTPPRPCSNARTTSAAHRPRPSSRRLRWGKNSSKTDVGASSPETATARPTQEGPETRKILTRERWRGCSIIGPATTVLPTEATNTSKSKRRVPRWSWSSRKCEGSNPNSKALSPPWKIDIHQPWFYFFYPLFLKGMNLKIFLQ